MLFCTQLITAQVSITTSNIIETRDGKNFYIHTVERGQTTYSISKAYDVTVDEIYFINPETKNGLSVGQTILIPTINKETELTNEVKTAKFDFFYHVAAKNETFQDVSSVYLIPKKYIVLANPGLKDPLREGEYVKIPVEDAFDVLDGKTQSKPQYTPPTETYTVKKPVTTETSRELPTPEPKETEKKTTSNTNTPLQQKTQSEFVTFDPDIPIIQDYRHVVIMGETTESIAQKYGVPADVLKAANPGLGNNVLKGDRLRIPDKKKLGNINNQETQKNKKPSKVDDNQSKIADSTPSKTGEDDFIKHTVKRKETLYSIGREYGVTADEIKAVNKGLTNLISIGQTILIPKKKITEPYIIHHVDDNTRVNRIARLYDVPPYQISDWNPELNKRIESGTDVKIPVGNKAIIVPIEEPEKEDHESNIDSRDVELDETTEIQINPKPDFNRTFNIALMIPLSVEELDSLDQHQFNRTRQSYFQPFRFIQFYEGMLLAIDSLEKQGMNVKLYVYDVDKNISKTAKVLQQPELKSMDLIIGPFYSDNYHQVALFAGNFNIPIINPLSYRESVIYDYNNSVKVKPGINSQINLATNFVTNFAPDSKVFLITENAYIDADIVTNLQNELLSNMNQHVKFGNYDLYNLSLQVAMRDTVFTIDSVPAPYSFEGNMLYPEILQANISDSTIINNYFIRINYSIDSLHPFIKNASVLRNNIVIVYGKRKSFILDVLNRMNETRDTFDIQLLGMPGWDRISNLSNEKMNNLNLSYFAADYIDYSDDITQDFIYNFRNTFFTEPDIYAYLGFDIGYYFLNNLFNYGDNFGISIVDNPMDLLLSKYNFKKINGTTNYENCYWHIIKLRNMTISKYPDYLINAKTTEYE